MSKTITLTRVFTTDKDRNNMPLMGKNGKPYTKMNLQAAEYGERWISGFQNKENKDWKAGDKVEVIIEEKTTDKGTFLNYSLPSAETKILGVAEQVSSMHNFLVSMNFTLLGIAEKVGAPVYSKPEVKSPVDYPDDDINAEDIPF